MSKYRDLFDSAANVGADVTIFERDHPDVDAELSAWAENHSLAVEREDFVLGEDKDTPWRISVMRVRLSIRHAITVHRNLAQQQEAA